MGTVEEIMNSIHKQGIEDEVFKLLMLWMITNRWNTDETKKERRSE